MSLINRNSKMFNKKKKKKERNAQELIPLGTIKNAIILNRGYMAIVYLETGKLTKNCLFYSSNISISNIFCFHCGFDIFVSFLARPYKKSCCTCGGVGFRKM